MSPGLKVATVFGASALVRIVKGKPSPAEPTYRHRWIEINRAPVHTLWASVVAGRLGFDQEEALTLGRAVAGLNAYSIGKALGLFEPTPEAVKEKREQLRREKGAFSRTCGGARSRRSIRKPARGRFKRISRRTGFGHELSRACLRRPP